MSSFGEILWNDEVASNSTYSSELQHTESESNSSNKVESRNSFLPIVLSDGQVEPLNCEVITRS